MEKESKEIKPDAYSLEAENLLKRRRASDNQSEVVGWINLSSNIIKGYRDGFISDKDIAMRERFLNYSYNRESMLVTCLGLLEKSNNPKSREQVEILKSHLAMLRNCRVTLMKNTPPKNIAKRIQQRQIEERKKNEEVAANKKDSGVKSLTEINPNLPYPSLSKKNRLFPSDAIMASLLLMKLRQDFPQIDIKNLLKAEGASLNIHTSSVEELLKAISILREYGVSDREIEQIAHQDPNNPNLFPKLERRFYPSESQKISENIQLISAPKSFYRQLAEAIHRHDVAHNIYDASLINPLINQRLAEKTREEILADTHKISQKNRVIETLQRKLINNHYNS